MVNAVRMNLPAYMGVRYELTNQIEDAEELLDNLHNYNQKIFKVCILIHTYGRNNAELDERVQQICNTGSSRRAGSALSRLSSALP